MLGPLELPITPSCTDCLSWSDDGELAIAAGEYVYILTPKINSEDSGELRVDGKFGRDQWYTTKFRANVFSDKDWPISSPRPVENFSIGAEQSISAVVALKWSPPGLAKYRRCILAVQTANLIVSIWEPLGHTNKWTRVSVVNHAIQNYFSPLVEDVELLHQKQQIRSFSWGPACDNSGLNRESTDLGTKQLGHGNRRYNFLAIANGDNEIVFLQVKKIQRDPATPKYLAVEALTHLALEPLPSQTSHIQPGTLLARSFNSKRWFSHISWGPWIYESPCGEGNNKVVRSVVAAIQRSGVRFIYLDATTERREVVQQEVDEQFGLRCYEGRRALQNSELEGFDITGPLLWTYTENYSNIALTIAALGGLITVEFPNGSYRTTKPEGCLEDPEAAIAVSSKLLLENTAFMTPEQDDERALSWDAVTGMVSTFDDGGTATTLHAATVFSHAQSTRVAGGIGNGNDETRKTPRWYAQIAEFRDRFDLDYDLGGYAIARTLGLTTHRGWIAACFTLHPSDMVEYITMTDERATIIFSPAEQPGSTDSEIPLPWTIPTLSSDRIRNAHQRVLRFVLGLEPAKFFQNVWERKILYAAACCAIVISREDELLSLSKRALLYLANESGADLTEEISKCDTTSSPLDGEGPTMTISPKSPQKLQGPGSELYEACEICGGGLEWYSDEEAQCSGGHQFVRCGLTFLSIQGPDGSKFCSLCGAEYLEEELLAETILHSNDRGFVRHTIFDTFDTCVYCGGKFRN